jgi:adenylate cyclase
MSAQSRQLAAIMFTDIVGYTALMGRDEQKAFELLDKNRQMQKPIVEQYNGRWIKELGDGVMTSFNTVSDAVNAAIKIQQICNTSKEFQLRIGIHLGEVVFEDGDVFGDGVNVASRIQAIANPGSIFISEAVHNSVSNKKEFQAKFFTEQKLKNVRGHVKVYQVLAEGVATAHQQITQKIRPKRNVVLLLLSLVIILIAAYIFKGGFTSAKNDQVVNAEAAMAKSIAVLPFVNMSADSSQEYFSDGMTESLISDLAQIPGLLVISRNSVFQYKGKAVNPTEVGKELNVSYILEGSVQRSGDILRFNVQLIKTKDGFHVWANKFDRQVKDLFEIQDDISRHIIDSLKIAIAGPGKHLRPPTDNLEAYDYYLQGHYLARKAGAGNRKLIDSAISLFEKAIAIDPKFALAYADAAKGYNAINFIYDPDPKWETKAFVATEQAISLDPDLADAYVAKGNLAWTLSNGFPHEQAVKELKRAIELNPNHVEAHESLGSIYFHIGLLDEALHELRIALTMDPASRFAHPRVARVFWYQQKFDSALAIFQSPKNPGGGWMREQALVLWYLGKTEEAFKSLDQIKNDQRLATEKSDLAAGYAVLYAGTGKKKEAEEEIKFSIEDGQGKSHFHHAEHLIASAYALMGETTKAVEWLQKTADHGMPCYPLLMNDPNLKSLKNDPGYISLMQKLKKQWEYYKANL